MAVTTTVDDVGATRIGVIDAYERARGPRRLVILPGGHFDASVDGFEGTSTPAREFFVEHLG